MTRAHVRLLGPCFKTGRVKDLHKHHDYWCLLTEDPLPENQHSGTASSATAQTNQVASRVSPEGGHR